ncbi:unnamed protein product [Leuciscus chuanchicus]
MAFYFSILFEGLCGVNAHPESGASPCGCRSRVVRLPPPSIQRACPAPHSDERRPRTDSLSHTGLITGAYSNDLNALKRKYTHTHTHTPHSPYSCVGQVLVHFVPWGRRFICGILAVLISTSFLNTSPASSKSTPSGAGSGWESHLVDIPLYRIEMTIAEKLGETCMSEKTMDL